jgi:hypothetical protein
MQNTPIRRRAASRLLVADNAHLTPGESPRLETVRRRTWLGQASWASGSVFCRDCEHWNDAGGPRGDSKLSRACQKYSDLMGRPGPRVPADAHACRLFEPNEAERARQELESRDL